MPVPEPPPVSLTLTILRTRKGWSQQDLGDAVGRRKTVISDYERGRRPLKLSVLHQFTAVMGYTPEHVALTLLYLGALFPDGAELPAALTAEDQNRARCLAVRVGLTEARQLYQRLLDLAGARVIEEARRHAEHEWDALRPLPASRQRDVIRNSPQMHNWALVERLCEESVQAAADDAIQSLELATTALRTAELIPVDSGDQLAAKGFAWAFVGNAQRVGIDRDAARRSFATAWRLWREGDGGKELPLGEWRILDLEASLRRDNRQFTEALALLERALAISPTRAKAHLLLNKAYAQEQAGDVNGALATLDNAAPLVDASADTNLAWRLGFNRAALLVHLGELGDAEALLPSLRALAIRSRRKMNLTRMVWLSGRVSAAAGKRGEARAAFEQARREFVAVGDADDGALVALEICALDLEDGKTAEVAALAGEVASIFRLLRVDRETLAALVVFCQAARAETATAEMARRIIEKWAYLAPTPNRGQPRSPSPPANRS